MLKISHPLFAVHSVITLITILMFQVNGYSQILNLKLASIYESKNKFQQAIEQYNKAIPKLEKDSVTKVYLKLYNLHQKQHELDGNATLHLRECINLSKKINRYSDNKLLIDSISNITNNWAKQVLHETVKARRKNNFVYKYLFSLPNLNTTDSVLLAGYQFALSESDENLMKFLVQALSYDQKNIKHETTEELFTNLIIENLDLFKKLDSNFLDTFKLSPTFAKRCFPVIQNKVDSVYNNLGNFNFSFREPEWEKVKYWYYLGQGFIDEDKIKAIYLHKTFSWNVKLSKIYKLPLKNDQLIVSQLSDNSFLYIPLSEDSIRLNKATYYHLFIKFLFNETYYLSSVNWYIDTTINNALKSEIIEALKVDSIKNKLLMGLAEETIQFAPINQIVFDFCYSSIKTNIKSKNDTSALKELYHLALAFPTNDFSAFEKWFVDYFKKCIIQNDISAYAKAALIMRHIYSDNSQFISIMTDYMHSEYQVAYLGSENLYTRRSKSFFNGDIDNCDAGTIAMKHHKQTLKRIQFYRRLYGLPDAVHMDSTKNKNQQAAALIMAASGRLSHHPDKTFDCLTYAGQAGAPSNLCLGGSGSGAIDSYITDFGERNYSAGHRLTVFTIGTLLNVNSGDIPNHANAFVAWSYKDLKNLYSYSPLCWPPAGPIYKKYVSIRSPWSFTLVGANFSNAEVYFVDGDKKKKLDIVYRISNSYSGRSSYIAFYIPKDDLSKIDIEINNVIDAYGNRKSFSYSVIPIEYK